MPKKLTQQEFEQRVYDCVGDKYKVISQYQGKNNPVTLYCNIHKCQFVLNAECFMRGKNQVRGVCPECSAEKRKIKNEDNRVILKCAYCNKEFSRSKSKLKNSRSGLYFCCREHKDLAQRLDSDTKFNIIQPKHYGISKDYRKIALNNFSHECAVCGWSEDVDILQVHHKDENRNNNNLENLIILCPNCHWKLTLHKYKLIGNKIIKI